MDDIDLESFGKKKKKKKRGEGLDDLGDVKEALPEAEDDDMDLDLDSFGTKKKMIGRSIISTTLTTQMK